MWGGRPLILGELILFEYGANLRRQSGGFETREQKEGFPNRPYTFLIGCVSQSQAIGFSPLPNGRPVRVPATSPATVHHHECLRVLSAGRRNRDDTAGG